MHRYLGRRRVGNLSSTPSLTSIDSIKEESLPSPSTLQECDDQLETYQILLKAKSLILTSLSEQLRDLRSQKEPLIRIKEALHEEIAKSNQAINAKSEEVTQLKNKLRHHSERQIQDNIERLEFQLRNNNYKPREEQKILDEICMLRRSFKTLKEFELKQRENKKYRSERYRLIEQRNEVFSKMQAIILQEEEIRQSIAENKEIINSVKNSIEHIKSLRPELEKAYYVEQKMKEQMRLKKLEEKSRVRKEEYIKRQEERKKRWEEYEASREPYEDEKDLCKMLLGYVQSLIPSQVNIDGSLISNSLLEKKSSEVPPAKLLVNDNMNDGVYYCKPKEEPLPDVRKSKKVKAKSKKEQKALKVKDLSHPPDVISNFDRLSITIPKTTEDVPCVIEALSAKLAHFHKLGKKTDDSVNKRDEIEKEIISVQLSSPSETNNISKINHVKERQSSSSHSTQLVDSPESENAPKTFKDSKLQHPTLTPINISNTLTNGSGTSTLYCPQSHSIRSQKPLLLTNPNASKSFFSIPVPMVANGKSKSNTDSDLPPTYASVTAKIGV